MRRCDNCYGELVSELDPLFFELNIRSGDDEELRETLFRICKRCLVGSILYPRGPVKVIDAKISG